MADRPAVVVSLGKAGMDLEGLVEVGDGRLELAQGVADRPAVVVSLGSVGSGPEGAVEVGERTSGVALNETGHSSETVVFGLAGQDHRMFPSCSGPGCRSYRLYPLLRYAADIRSLQAPSNFFLQPGGSSSWSRPAVFPQRLPVI